MKSFESTLYYGLKYSTIAIVTCAIATIGLGIANLPSAKARDSSANFSLTHWMFWITGRDLEEELQNPTPVFEFSSQAIPAWDSEKIESLSNYFKKKQEARDQMMEEIRARWGTPD